MWDFTLAAYERLLRAVVEGGYNVVTVRDYLSGKREPPLLILRHDVEWNSRRARDIAELELKQGLRSTFYFRADTSAYDVPLMLWLQNQGFEIGYHFNTLDRCSGDFDKAVALFEKELTQFREAGINVLTVCSHGDPRVKKRGYSVNYEIFLKDQGLKDRTSILGEAYLDIDFSSLKYISDVGIRWSVGVSTEQLLKLIQKKNEPCMYILTHPDYWSRTWARALLLQCAARSIRVFRINKVIAAIKGFIHG